MLQSTSMSLRFLTWLLILTSLWLFIWMNTSIASISECNNHMKHFISSILCKLSSCLNTLIFNAFQALFSSLRHFFLLFYISMHVYFAFLNFLSFKFPVFMYFYILILTNFEFFRKVFISINLRQLTRINVTKGRKVVGYTTW